MGTLVKLLASATLYTCVATVISQSITIGYLWAMGGLDRHRMQQIVDIVQGVDMIPADRVGSETPADPAAQQTAYEEILQKRAALSLDLDLRETAVEKGLEDLHMLAANISENARRFDIRREAFQAKLKELEEGATDTAIMEVRRTLEAMRPRQAKDQMMLMLKDDQVSAVVTIIKGMSMDKRKKLLAEFKQADEQDRLAEILQQILQGVPETEVIKDAKTELSQSQP